MSLFSGTKITDRDIVRGIDTQVRKLVRRFSDGLIDEPDCARQLVDLLVRAVNANTRRVSRDTEQETADAKD